MRNEFIGASIDNDARAACGCNGSANTINTACSGYCDNCRQPRPCGCGRQSRPCGCSNHCDNDHSRQHRQDSCDCNDRDKGFARQNDSDCNKGFARQNDCDCNKDYASKGDRNRRTPAMVYAKHHDLDSMYDAPHALKRGTLFGCLDKPMCGERCADNACTTCCQEDKFTVWELRLYLNTHPCDQKALALYNKLVQKMDEDCACTFTSDCSRWSWTDGPWPWEYQRCCEKED